MRQVRQVRQVRRVPRATAPHIIRRSRADLPDTMSFDQFVAVIRAFERERVDYVLVGGVAVNVHGIVRTTEDVDLLLRERFGLSPGED